MGSTVWGPMVKLTFFKVYIDGSNITTFIRVNAAFDSGICQWSHCYQAQIFRTVVWSSTQGNFLPQLEGLEDFFINIQPPKWWRDINSR